MRKDWPVNLGISVSQDEHTPAVGDWPAQHLEFILVQNRTVRY